MAGDWIKMRGTLINSPKLIRLTRELQKNPQFREWLAPGGGGAINGQIVSPSASRTVTLGALTVTWSAAREHGKFVGNDLVMRISVDELDDISGVPGIGRAMEAVGWAQASEDGTAVTLPNFKEYNVPLSTAERSKAYRGRASAAVTDRHERRHGPSRRERPKSRVEERRRQSPLDSVANGENSEATPLPSGKKPRARDELFDAVAEITGADPKTTGSHIGKVCADLRKSEPPYTPAEVLRLPDVLASQGWSVPITLGVVVKQIGWVRKPPKKGRSPPAPVDPMAGHREYMERRKQQNGDGESLA